MEQQIIMLKRRGGGITYMVHEDYIKVLEYYDKIWKQHLQDKFIKPSKS